MNITDRLDTMLKQIRENNRTINQGGCGYAALMISDMLTRLGIKHKVVGLEDPVRWMIFNPFPTLRKEIKYYGKSYDKALAYSLEMHKAGEGRVLPTPLFNHFAIKVDGELFDASGRLEDMWVQKGTVKRDTLLALVRCKSIWNDSFNRKPGSVQSIVQQIESVLQKEVDVAL